ncbi:MAG: MoaD/ThiS family protein [Acidimicrobiia bacterium]|nr:MoaD/ThiS family protein [Acidimicrobiia bacterium]
MKVRIPTPLRSYTTGRAVVEAEGATIDELLDDLDQRYPGIRFRIVDEQARLRPHVSIFVNAERERDLSTTLEGIDEVTVMQALSGG